MKFGKKLRATVEQSYTEWQPMFISYKSLKKCINPRTPDDDVDSKDSDSKDHDLDPLTVVQVPPSTKSIPQHTHNLDTPSKSLADDSNASATPQIPSAAQHTFNIEAVRKAEQNHSQFFNQFRLEVDKVNEFFLDKQEDYIIEHRQLSAKVDDFLVPGRATRQEVNRLRQRLTNFHGELVLLENFSTVNYTGFRKILKKHDKKTGLNMRDVYLRTVLITPFFLSNTVRKLILSTEASLGKLDTIRKFRRPTVMTSLPLDSRPSAPSTTPTPTSTQAIAPSREGPLTLTPSLSPPAHVVMEPPHPHAFITPRSALWRLYRDARDFGFAIAAAATPGPDGSIQPTPPIPERLMTLVDHVNPDELGLTSSFLSAVTQPSHYLIAGEPTFSLGFFVLPAKSPALQLFGSSANQTFITRNLRGTARLRRFTSCTSGSTSTTASDADGAENADGLNDFRVELTGEGSTTGAWPAVAACSVDRFVEWTPHSALALFYVACPALTEDIWPRFDVRPLSPPVFRVSRATERLSLTRVIC